jgi:hypothetical protein
MLGRLIALTVVWLIAGAVVTPLIPGGDVAIG